MTRILIADDHPLFRHGLRHLLEAEGDLRVCGEVDDGHAAVHQVRQQVPDLLLLDVSMPGASGLDALRELADDDTVATVILILTAAIEQDELVTALQLGARGVVMKDAPAPLLLRAIRGVLAGEYWVGRERVASLIHALRPLTHHHAAPASDHGLTPRELLIVSGVVAAFGNRDLAAVLGISEKTVKQHLTNIFDKLGVSSRVELAMFAVRRQLHLPDFPPDK